MEVWKSGRLQRIYAPENPQVFPGRRGSAGSKSRHLLTERSRSLLETAADPWITALGLAP